MSLKNFYNFGDQNQGTWTPEGILHFPKLTVPEPYSMHVNTPGAKKYYSASVHIPKAVMAEWLNSTIWSEFKTGLATIYKGGLVKTFVPGFDATMDLPAGFKFAWKDGDMAGKDGATPLDAGHIILNCNRNSTTVSGAKRPAPRAWVVKGENSLELHDPADIDTEVYAGAVVRVNVSPNLYNQGGGIGIGFSLNGVLKLRDGTRIGGGGGNINADAALGALGLKPLEEIAPPGLNDL